MGHGGRASRRKGNRTERAGPGLAWARAHLSTPRGAKDYQSRSGKFLSLMNWM